MSVQDYLDKHMLSRRIEDAVNAAVRAKSADPVLFISNHMRRATSSVITKIKARRILDYSGIPTVEVDLYTNKGMFRAAAPSVNLEKRYDSLETPEGDTVSKFVKVIDERISEALIGLDPTIQSQVDSILMDLIKEDIKGDLGRNITVPVSIAACKAGAAEKEVPLSKHIADLSGQSKVLLPVPAISVISGRGGVRSNFFAQEIMILPVGADTFEEAIEMSIGTYSHLKVIILEKYEHTTISNEGERGGFAPYPIDLREALDLVKEAIDKAGFGGRIKMAVALAAADSRVGTKYDLNFKSTTGEYSVEMYTQLCSDYPIVSLEDPFDKNNIESYRKFTHLGVCQVVGGQMFLSEPSYIDRAIRESACNGLLLEMSQLGTVTEAIELAKKAKEALWGLVVSEAGGKFEGSFLADLASGLGAGLMKAGRPGENNLVAKFNQLLRIEEELGEDAAYVGENWRPPSA